MKFGIKLWSVNHDLYQELVDLIKQGKVDYLELLYIPGEKKKLELLKESKIPIIIHASSSVHGFRLGGDNIERNDKMLKETFQIADYLNAERVIIHPDLGKKENFVKLLKKNQDERVVIENMPMKAIGLGKCMGYTPKEIKEFLSFGPFGFCLDLTHAMKSAVSQKLDYKKYLKEFMKIEPVMFHICDGNIDYEKDEHLSIGEGNMDFDFIKTLIKESEKETNESREITFEVPKENGLKKDVKNIEFFKAIK